MRAGWSADESGMNLWKGVPPESFMNNSGDLKKKNLQKRWNILYPRRK